MFSLFVYVVLFGNYIEESFCGKMVLNDIIIIIVFFSVSGEVRFKNVIVSII